MIELNCKRSKHAVAVNAHLCDKAWNTQYGKTNILIEVYTDLTRHLSFVFLLRRQIAHRLGGSEGDQTGNLGGVVEKLNNRSPGMANSCFPCGGLDSRGAPWHTSGGWILFLSELFYCFWRTARLPGSLRTWGGYPNITKTVFSEGVAIELGPPV